MGKRKMRVSTLLSRSREIPTLQEPLYPVVMSPIGFGPHFPGLFEMLSTCRCGALQGLPDLGRVQLFFSGLSSKI